MALLHCVLTHHGAQARPGGRFASPEALALYRVNALDAGVKGALEHGLGSGGEGDDLEMTFVDELLANNRGYADGYEPRPPRRRARAGGWRS